MERYKPFEYPVLKQGFRQAFNVSVGKFIDNEYTAAMAYVVIDILKFDEWLHEQFGDYESRGYTMSTLVHEKYGPAALELLNKIT